MVVLYVRDNNLFKIKEDKLNVYIMVIIVLYLFAGFSYLTGMLEVENIAAELNKIGDKIKIKADPLLTPISDNGLKAKILIILIWPLFALLGTYLMAKRNNLSIKVKE